MNLYNITTEYATLLDQIVNEETGEVNENALARLNEVKESAEQKSIALASYIQNLDAERNAIEAARQEMAKREKALQNKADYLTNYLQENMERLSITEIKCPYFQIKLKKNPVSVEVYDELSLPDDYKKSKIVVNVDKAKIRNELLAGVVIAGAQLKQNTRIEIR